MQAVCENFDSAAAFLMRAMAEEVAYNGASFRFLHTEENDEGEVLFLEGATSKGDWDVVDEYTHRHRVAMFDAHE
jgi:hypothetical protein